MPYKILHVIPALGLGGANMMLYKLVKYMNRDRFENSIVTLLPENALDERIRELGIEVLNLSGVRGAVPGIKVWRELIRHTREIRPDIIQGWMYHGNLAATITRIFAASTAKVVWNIRQSLYALKNESKITRLTIRLNAFLSRSPDYILNNSWISQEQHIKYGFHSDKCRVIPNGFDTGRFQPNPEARSKIRREIGIKDDEFVVCKIARLHPMKGHTTFLDAAGILCRAFNNVHFWIVGPEDTITHKQLEQMIAERGLSEHVHYLGSRNDTADILTAVDIASSSSSWGEGFPNVIGEAMSCGVPCVVTDVGDCTRIVGETGLIVPPRNPEAIANAIKAFLSMPSAERRPWGGRARKRIENHYSIEKIVRKYEYLYDSLVDK